jgi:hypothetical protein
MGIGYLVFGQVGSVVSRGYSNEQVSNYIFTTNTYSTIERVVRYVAYTHFDFWWHTPGFDHERHIIQLLSGLEVFFGQLFPIYLGGWIAITTTLTGIIIAGITVLVRRRDLTASYVLVWLGVYALLWNAKNLNWSGGFNTRHVHTVVPALCLAFGVGAAWLVARIDKEQISSRIPDWQANRSTALVVMISVLFVILIVNGAVQGTVRAEKNSISYEKPIGQLASIADDGDTVAVTQRRSYDYTLIYTHGDIRPVILLAEDQTRHHETRTVLADLQVVDPSHIYQTDIDYLFVNNFQCRDTTARERAMIDNATLNGGEVVHHEVVNRPRFRCSEFETYIVRIGST